MNLIRTCFCRRKYRNNDLVCQFNVDRKIWYGADMILENVSSGFCFFDTEVMTSVKPTKGDRSSRSFPSSRSVRGWRNRSESGGGMRRNTQDIGHGRPPCLFNRAGVRTLTRMRRQASSSYNSYLKPRWAWMISRSSKLVRTDAMDSPR